MLDQLLEYHETPERGDFTAAVMRGVSRQRRIRKLILAGSGLVGAAFGMAGMMLLSEPVSRFLGEVDLLPVSLGAVLIVAMVTWLLYDEAGLAG